MQSWLDLHSHELLEQEFAGVRYLDLADVLGRIAPSAVVLALEQVRLAEQATGVANMHSVAIRDVKEALFEEPGGAVADHAVTLHLTESETTVARTTFRRLAGQDLRRTSPS